MNNNDLIGLREIFRKKFREEDFHDEEQVEKVFRELLNEPEPNRMIEIIKEELTIEKVKEIFEKDDPFYEAIMKRK